MKDSVELHDGKCTTFLKTVFLRCTPAFQIANFFFSLHMTGALTKYMAMHVTQAASSYIRHHLQYETKTL